MPGPTSSIADADGICSGLSGICGLAGKVGPNGVVRNYLLRQVFVRDKRPRSIVAVCKRGQLRSGILGTLVPHASDYLSRCCNILGTSFPVQLSRKIAPLREDRCGKANRVGSTFLRLLIE